MLKKLHALELQHVSLQQWLLVVVTVAGVAMALRLVQRVITRHHFKLTQHGALQRWHDLIVQCAERTSWMFQVAIGLWVARLVVKIPQPWDRRLQALVTAAVIIQAGFWANGLVDRLILVKLDHLSSQGDTAYKTGRNMLRSAGLVLVWAAVLLLTFENLGIHISALVAGLGVTGVAVAFATQNILSDLIASISMLLDKPFLVGDFIVVDTFMGTVQRIGVRTTRLRSLSGEELILANSDLAKSRIRNLKRMTERRVLFTFALNYNTPTKLLRSVGAWVETVISRQEKTRFDRASLLTFGDNGLVFECVFYVLDSDYNLYMQLQHEINVGIMEVLEENNVAFAFGTQFKWVPTPPLDSVGASATDATPLPNAQFSHN